MSRCPVITATSPSSTRPAGRGSSGSGSPSPVEYRNVTLWWPSARVIGVTETSKGACASVEAHRATRPSSSIHYNLMTPVATAVKLLTVWRTKALRCILSFEVVHVNSVEVYLLKQLTYKDSKMVSVAAIFN